jgi:hypothetical protein
MSQHGVNRRHPQRGQALIRAVLASGAYGNGRHDGRRRDVAPEPATVPELRRCDGAGRRCLSRRSTPPWLSKKPGNRGTNNVVKSSEIKKIEVRTAGYPNDTLTFSSTVSPTGCSPVFWVIPAAMSAPTPAARIGSLAGGLVFIDGGNNLLGKRVLNSSA